MSKSYALRIPRGAAEQRSVYPKRQLSLDLCIRWMQLIPGSHTGASPSG